MSYPAQRWARAQVLRIGRKPVAIAVLNVIANAYRPDGRVPLNRAAIALRVGVTVETVAAALKTLAAAGIISYRVIRDDSNIVLGTLYTLHGFNPEDWPEGREGERVMVEQALSAGCEPQPWWPRFRRHLSPENGLEAPSDGDSQREGDSLNYPGTLPLNCRGTLSPSDRGTLPPQSTGTLPPSIRCKTVLKDGSNKTVLKDSNQDGTADAFVGAVASTPERENLQAVDALFPDPQQEEVETETVPEGHSLSPVKEKPKAKRATPCPYEKIRAAYAEALPALSQPRAVSEPLKKNMRARMAELRREEGLKTEAEIVEGFRRFFADVAATPFLLGENENGWRASLDWLMKAANFAKVRAGNYRRTRAAVRKPAAPRALGAAGFDPYDRRDASRYGPQKTEAELKAALKAAEEETKKALAEGLPF